MKNPSIVTTKNCIGLINMETKAYTNTLTEFLKAFEEPYWQPLMVEFFRLEFEFLLN